MSACAPWRCPNCDRTVATPFCPVCGERELQARDLSLRGILDQVIRSFGVDGRAMRSFRCLLTRPGALTAAYRSGQRKPYLGPLSLFLIANLLFFAVQSVSDVKVFSTSLDMHLHDQAWSGAAQQLVTRRLVTSGRTLERYTPVFNQAVRGHAKSLIGLMVLPFALLPALLFRAAGRPFALHVVFSLHFHAFLLLLLCVPLLAVAVNGWLGGAHIPSPRVDDALSILLLSISAIYLHIAVGIVYGARGVLRMVKVLGLTVALAGIFLAYRFVLLPITLYTT